MSREILRLLTVLLCAVMISAHAQDGVAERYAGESFAARAQALQENISQGWGERDVRAIMGDPDRIEERTDGQDTVLVWGYGGYDVRIEFRNGYVERWFVRFSK